MNLQQKQSLIFNHYGLWHQIGKLKEELNELLDEVNLSIDNNKLTKNFASELADVRNLCDQISMHISQYKINKIQHEKCNREIRRINKRKHTFIHKDIRDVAVSNAPLSVDEIREVGGKG